MKLLFLILSTILMTRGDTVIDGMLPSKNVDDQLKQRAERDLGEKTTAGLSYYYEMKDSSGAILARMNLTGGPLTLNLLQTVKNEKDQIVWVKDKYRQPKKYGSADLAGAATTSATKKDDGSIDVTITYNGAFGDKSVFGVETATIKMSVVTGAPKKDYWIVANVTASLTGSRNDSETKTMTPVTITDLDLTPRYGYTVKDRDSACTNGYSICAPLHLTWTCDSQSLRPVDLKQLGAVYTVQLDLTGLYLQLGAGHNTSRTYASWGYNWDCDPLFPLELWVCVLVTLLMAAILTYGIAMVSSIATPDKFDDPKGPSIHVGNTE